MGSKKVSSRLTKLNTIVAGGGSGTNCYGVLNDLGYNLFSDASAGFSGPGSLNNTNPKLGPLDNCGGPTLTMALLSDSPAIDGGSPVSFPSSDQRGRPRPFGASSDIGSFESTPPFFVRGTFSGKTLKDEVSVEVEEKFVFTTNHNYSLALNAGNYTVMPGSPDYLFVPRRLDGPHRCKFSGVPLERLESGRDHRWGNACAGGGDQRIRLSIGDFDESNPVVLNPHQHHWIEQLLGALPVYRK
jgi:hypothetical protein